MLGEQEHQVYVGGEVEFAAAELAHADDDQFLRGARGRAGHAVARGEDASGVPLGLPDRAFGKRRLVLQGLGDGGEAGQVPPGDAHHFPGPPAAQCRHQSGLFGRRVDGPGRCARGEETHGIGARLGLQVTAGQQRGKQLRIALAGLAHEGAGRGNPARGSTQPRGCRPWQADQWHGQSVSSNGVHAARTISPS